MNKDNEILSDPTEVIAPGEDGGTLVLPGENSPKAETSENPEDPEDSETAGSPAADQTGEETSSDYDYDFSDPAKEKPLRPDYVGMTVRSGLLPLECRYSQINSCFRRLPMAYRSYTYINSVTEGIIPPEKYAYAADTGESGMKLARWNICAAIKAVRAFEAAGRHIEFVTARCPAKLAFEDDLYTYVKNILDENDFHSPEKLCLEFPQTVLYQNEDKVRLSLLNMKLLKVRTMMSGAGSKDCPVTAILNLPFDYVLLSPMITMLSDSRARGKAINALIGFYRSLSINVICDGVSNDQQISNLNRADCVGYIPSSGYEGVLTHGRLRMTLKDAVSQKEEDI